MVIYQARLLLTKTGYHVS